MTKSVKHFLTLMDLTPNQLNKLVERAIELKAAWKKGAIYTPLLHRSLAMIFDKSSTRTRVSFEAGITQLGGHAIFLSPNDTQLGRGEPIPDAARVISSMTDIVMIRTFEQTAVETFAQYSSVPVINALTDDYHPCQLLADIMTFVEQRGSMTGATVTWVGDGNNMCHSWMNAARLLNFKLNIACPEGYEPNPQLLADCGTHAEIISDVKLASQGSDLIVTDVWASMGQEEEQKLRELAFADYQVNSALMKEANNDALFMHCLPAHRGEEVSTAVLEGQQSVVWQEAENRLHAQKSLMLTLLDL
ncbi:MAG: ornithine carbamoyltransferase [Thiotrichaceae bacterium]|nr:ornithine carbamoyltransferase [Thiotrichaceae bacterium]